MADGTQQGGSNAEVERPRLGRRHHDDPLVSVVRPERLAGRVHHGVHLVYDLLNVLSAISSAYDERRVRVPLRKEDIVEGN